MTPKRKFLKLQVTTEEKELIERIYGPKRHMSANVRRILLDPYARRAPDQHKEIISAVNAISSKLEDLLKGGTPVNTNELAAYVEACFGALVLLRELHRHAA
jgi:hypothetical protein